MLIHYRHSVIRYARWLVLSIKEDEKQDVSIRVITDHIRSVTFMVSDVLCHLMKAEAMYLEDF